MIKLAKIIQYILVGIVCLYVAIGIFMIVVSLLTEPGDLSYIEDVIIFVGKYVIGFGILAVLVKALRIYIEKNKK